MAIALPDAQPRMREQILELCRANDHQNGYIRLTVTRGTGLGLDPKHIEGGANTFISNEQLRLYPSELYQTGLKMITSSTRLPAPQIIDPRIKCTGKYANNIQAKLEANLQGAGEAVMLNQQGYVAECTGDNIFIIKNGVVKTPPPYACGLQGITRDTVIMLARKNGIEVDETMMTNYDIYTARRVFLDRDRRGSDSRHRAGRTRNRRRPGRADDHAPDPAVPRSHAGNRRGVLEAPAISAPHPRSYYKIQGVVLRWPEHRAEGSFGEVRSTCLSAGEFTPERSRTILQPGAATFEIACRRV